MSCRRALVLDPGQDPSHWDVIIGGMIGVTNPTGTARRSRAGAPTDAGRPARVFSVGQNQQYKESEVEERLRDHALFVAFAPADAPKLAVAVLVENGKSGSGTAAPIARAVFDAYLLPPAAAIKAEAATPAPAAGSEE